MPSQRRSSSTGSDKILQLIVVVDVDPVVFVDVATTVLVVVVTEIVALLLFFVVAAGALSVVLVHIRYFGICRKHPKVKEKIFQLERTIKFNLILNWYSFCCL